MILNKDIQPTIYREAIVKCGCGNSWVTGSTEERLSVEICSSCHPFWTGDARIVDTEGRVERLKRRFNYK